MSKFPFPIPHECNWYCGRKYLNAHADVTFLADPGEMNDATKAEMWQWTGMLIIESVPVVEVQSAPDFYRQRGYPADLIRLMATFPYGHLVHFTVSEGAALLTHAQHIEWVRRSCSIVPDFNLTPYGAAFR